LYTFLGHKLPNIEEVHLRLNNKDTDYELPHDIWDYLAASLSDQI